MWGRGTDHSPRMQYAVTTPDRGYPLAMRLPPDDPAYAGADSSGLTRRVAELLRALS